MNAPTTGSPKLILFGEENRQLIQQGAEVFARAVTVTYGPHGKIAMLNRAAGLLATKDGVTVAREIFLKNRVANMAAQALKQACIKVNDDAGDGTTSTACISAALIQEGCKLITGGMDPIKLSRGIKMASEEASRVIYGISLEITTQSQLESVALIASNGDQEIAAQMAEAVMAVGKNGTVSIEDGHGVETVLEFKEGMEIDRGAASIGFLSNKDGDGVQRILEGPLVACYAGTLSSVEDVLDMCEEATTFGNRPLVVFCHGINGHALDTLMRNDVESSYTFIPILSPGNFEKKTDYLGDIAAMSGADLVDPNAGGSSKKWDRTWFGALRHMTVKAKESTLIAYDEASEAIADRIAYIKAQFQHTSTQYDIDRLNERLAVLEGGLCIMKIGAHTEAELKEKRARIEDALGAVQGALEDGIVPGGGTTYLATSMALEGQCPSEDLDIQAGWDLFCRALCKPVEVLARNAGYNGDFVVAKLKDLRSEGPWDSWLGWDAIQNTYRDFEDSEDIIDPTRVALAVVEASASAASILMTAEASISVKV